jgi:4-hydroxy-3-methylbut-2-en-1-yl diphosphate synthase IspG/GcpE
MGCVVNGPGEAREADIGIAGGHGVGIIFKKGELFRKVPEAELLPVFLEELEKTGSRNNRTEPAIGILKTARIPAGSAAVTPATEN